MIIELRPKFRESIQGRNTFNVIAGKRIGTTKAQDGTFTFAIPDNARTKTLNINFSELVDNPYFGKEEDLPSNWSGKDIYKKQKISKQQFYELKHNRVPGFYDYSAFQLTGSSDPLKKRTRTYLQKFKKILSDGVNQLNLDDPDDEIMYEAVLANNHLFAKNYDEAQESDTIRFYISHISEEEERKANKRKMLLKASSMLTELFDKYPAKVKDFASVLRLSKGNVAAEIVENSLYDWISDEAKIANKSQEVRIEEFSNFFKLLTSKDIKDKERFAAYVLLRNLVNERVLVDYQDKYKWVSQNGTNLETIGRSEKEAIEFLLSSDNTGVVESLKKELKERL